MFNLNTIVRKNILELKPYSSARSEFKLQDGIFLDANENPFGNYNRYPDPEQKALKTFIAKRENISEGSIFIGNGSDEIIDLIFRVFCNPGIDKALIFSPTYGMYSVLAAINDVELIDSPLNEKFNLDENNLNRISSIESLKVIFICSPNNPTGNALDPTIITQIIQTFKGIVVIDEAYIDFSKNDSFLIMLSKFPNLIICQTLSKAYGLASIRIGIGYASEKIIALLNKIKPPYNVSGINQKIALEKLLQTEENQANVKSILKEKARLLPILNSFDFVLKIYPSDANFLLIKVNDANKIYQKLIEASVIIRNRNTEIPGCIRISIGSEAENETLINALKSIK